MTDAGGVPLDDSVAMDGDHAPLDAVALGHGPVPTSDLDGLARQVERGGVRTQSLFNRTFERLSEVETILLGLVDVLLERKVVTEAEIEPAVRRVEEQMATRADPAPQAVALRVDSPSAAARPEVFVDCAARMHVCHAVCCKLAVKLDAEEVEAGRLRWDLGRPYYLRKEADGRCTHQDRSTGGCGVYADRPKPCRQYSCANDRRIWKDFDGMVLNDAWLSDHFKPDEPQFITIQPRR